MPRLNCRDPFCRGPFCRDQGRIGGYRRCDINHSAVVYPRLLVRRMKPAIDIKAPKVLRRSGRNSGSGVQATAIAYAELKRRINANELAAGRMYKQDEIAAMLEISRTPAREALIRLAEEGLVEFRPRHGVCIRLVSIDELAGTYEVLTMLEAQAARRLAERGASAEGLARLELAHRSMEAALHNREIAAWIDADEAFHKVLVSECGNEPLRRIVHALWDRLRRVRHMTRSLRTLPANSNRDHANLIRAIRRREAQKAFDVHHKHRQDAMTAMLALLDHHGIREI